MEVYAQVERPKPTTSTTFSRKHPYISCLTNYAIILCARSEFVEALDLLEQAARLAPALKALQQSYRTLKMKAKYDAYLEQHLVPEQLAQGEWAPSVARVDSIVDPHNVWLALTCCWTCPFSTWIPSTSPAAAFDRLPFAAFLP
jgi:hypothetical protein